MYLWYARTYVIQKVVYFAVNGALKVNHLRRRDVYQALERRES